MAKAPAASEVQEKSASTYTYEQIADSEAFKADRDILGALLDRDKSYTRDELEKIVKDFKARPVKEKVNGGKN